MYWYQYGLHWRQNSVEYSSRSSKVLLDQAMDVGLEQRP